MRKINHLINDNSGVILVTVVMLAIVLSFVAIGIISISTSHTTSTTSVVDSVKAEQLAAGEFYRFHQIMLEGCQGPPSGPCAVDGDCSTCSTSSPETLNYKTYTYGIVDTAGTGDFVNLQKVDVSITYP